MKYSITVQESIFIARSVEDVWDFTQDYGKRTLWDGSVREAYLLQENPRRAEIKGRGLCAELAYKQYERPHKTSLVMENIRSIFVTGGGGSWKYETVPGGTKWTQTNTLVVRDDRYSTVIMLLVRYLLKRNTRRAMKKAKRILERDEG